MNGWLKMKRTFQRVIGCCLSLLMLGSCGCSPKKKNSGDVSESVSHEKNIVLNQGQFVKEEDTFFETKEIPLQVPIDSDKTVKCVEYLDTLIRDNQVICGYLIEYEEQIWVYGVAVYTTEGELAQNVILPQNEILNAISLGNAGEILAISMKETNGEHFNSGVGAEAAMSVGICAASSGKEEAFEFILYLLSPEIQTQLSYYLSGFPVHRAACKEATERLVNEEEDFILAPSDPSMAQPGKYYVEKKVICEGIPELMGDVNAAIYTDPIIQDIVKEEAASYFNNQKSVEEVCSTIQNRAQIVIQERES